MTYTLQLETPVGPVTITATGEAVTQIRFGTEIPEGSAAVPETSATPLLLKAAIATIAKALPLIPFFDQLWLNTIKGLIILIVVVMNVVLQRVADKNALKGREM